MRTIKNLLKNERKVYIYLNSKAIRYRFMSDAELEGITYGGGVLPTEREADDIMCLCPDGTICYVGIVYRMYNKCKKDIIRVDYEKYINNERMYIVYVTV